MVALRKTIVNKRSPQGALLLCGGFLDLAESKNPICGESRSF